MNHHLEQEITALNKRMARQGTEVECAVRQALDALQQRDATLATQVVANDDAIDREEVRLEEECLKILALHQPVAGDLRYIITLLKVNNELERIGDLAVNIAERVLDLIQEPASAVAPDISPMFHAVLTQLKNALDALLGRDCFLAAQVIAADDTVDEMNRANFRHALERLRAQPEQADTLLCFLNISRNLERMADACTNIGEDVMYLEQGTIVRHQQH